MNATCPRCGTVSLVGQHETRFTCKTCRLSFCAECRHWKDERKQTYCARCGAPFNQPPPVMPYQIMNIMFLSSIGAALLLMAFGRPQPWQTALVVILPSVIYTALYLFVFNLRTGLTHIARRETIFFIRRTLMLATLALYRRDAGPVHDAYPVRSAWWCVLFVIGLAARRLDAVVIGELREHRRAWQAILSTPYRKLALLRFPDLRAAK